jgi:hypothetical protein
VCSPLMLILRSHRSFMATFGEVGVGAERERERDDMQYREEGLDLS